MNTNALRLMIDAIAPELRATTHCGSAAQLEQLIDEVDRLNSVIASMQAAKGGEIMADAKEIAARGAFQQDYRPYRAPGGPVQIRAALETALQESRGTAVCSCPSGDGSLRWPCAIHSAQPAAPGEVILALLHDAFDTLESSSDSDIDFEDDEDERQGAPAQYAARKIMAAITTIVATPVPDPKSKLSAAARDVLAERQRQISAEGWTPQHDDGYSGGEMAQAAAVYAIFGGHEGRVGRNSVLPGIAQQLWPWNWDWFKPRGQRRDLERAAALLIAEMERLDRAAAKAEMHLRETAGDPFEVNSEAAAIAAERNAAAAEKAGDQS